MPAFPTPPTGGPNWFELVTSDPDAAVAFYTGLFGWEHLSFGPEYGNYGQFLRNGVPIAGVGPILEPEQPAGWFVYLQSSDVEATAEAVQAEGGTVVIGPREVGDQGRMAVAADPAGAAVKFWQPGAHAGTGLTREHGTPVWFELLTRDYDAAVAFYTNALGWDAHTMADEPALRYTTLGEGDDAVAGIWDVSGEAGIGSTWTVYLGCDDVDASAAQVAQLGGSILAAPADSPYGRWGTVADPLGSEFRIMGL